MKISDNTLIAVFVVCSAIMLMATLLSPETEASKAKGCGNACEKTHQRMMRYDPKDGCFCEGALP